MVSSFIIRKNEYHDSVFLMRVARRISEQKGIIDAAALMGTEKNKALFAQIGFSGEGITSATPNDLVVAIKAESDRALNEILSNIDRWLHPAAEQGAAKDVRTLDEALVRQPDSNLAVISVPGAYAAREAQKAMDRGLHVFLFSDNVPVESERSLKEFARERGLLVMGPDCGTALISGIGIGFANVVRRGSVGVIGASGTGIQEFTTLVHRAGSGISHAIGTGSRDLSDAVGGLSTFSALEALEADPETKAIAILSKPPGPQTLARLIPRLSRCSKPVIPCLLGLKEDPFSGSAELRNTRTLDEAASRAVELITGKPITPDFPDRTIIARERDGMRPGQKYIRGIFAGGTFCYQAQQILGEYGIIAFSNAPLHGNRPLADPLSSVEHSLVDMGADEFTVGRAHPMIDPALRNARILSEARDPVVAVLLLDFILGFNASPDPAGDLCPAIRQAKAEAVKRGGYLAVIASVCGTEDDPQGLEKQIHSLQETGAVVLRSSAEAARMSARIVSESSKIN